MARLRSRLKPGGTGDAMIWKVDTEWLVYAFVVVTMISYLVGYAMYKVLDRSSFGPAGNMAVLVIGFFGGIYIANTYGLRFKGLQMATGAGLGFAFLFFTIAIAAKALFYRR